MRGSPLADRNATASGVMYFGMAARCVAARCAIVLIDNVNDGSDSF